jgi:hypothetical protein
MATVDAMIDLCLVTMGGEDSCIRRENRISPLLHLRDDRIVFRGIPRFLALDVIEAVVEKNGVEFDQALVAGHSIDLSEVEQAEVAGGEELANGRELAIGRLAGSSQPWRSSFSRKGGLSANRSTSVSRVNAGTLIVTPGRLCVPAQYASSAGRNDAQ